MMKQILKNKQFQKLIAILALGVFLRILFFPGFYPSDQYSYSVDAVKIVNGKWQVPDYGASTRWGIIIPTAFFYWLLGVNEFSSTLWSMLCSIGTMIVAYLLGKQLKDETSGLLAAFLLAIFPLEIIYAGQLMADGPLSFWLLFALFCFLRGEALEARKTRRVSYLLSGFALAMAYASKLVTMLIAPFFIVYIIVRRRIDLQHGWIFLGFVIVFALEFMVYQVAAGNGFHRLSLMMQAGARQSPGIASGSLNAITGIWAYFYWLLVDIHYVGIAFVVLAIILIFRIVKHWPRENTETWQYWSVVHWSVTMMMILSFFPISTKPYIPIYKQSNYMLMFTAPMLVVLGFALTQIPHHYRYVCLCLIFLCGLPCSYVMKESHRAHVDNSRAIYSFYKEHRDLPLFAATYNVASLQYLDGFGCNHKYKDFTTRKPSFPDSSENPFSEVKSFYVAIDEYFIGFYGSRGHKYPSEILKPPADWSHVFRYQRRPNFLKSISIGLLEILRRKGLIGFDIYSRALGKAESWSHSKPVDIYATDFD